MFRRILTSLLFTTLLFQSCLEKANEHNGNVMPSSQPRLIWSDEFNVGEMPDSTRWGYDLGNGCELPAGCGWGNNELQYYTNEPQNARIENGLLIIEAHREARKNSEFTSARLVSREKGDWKYGRIEVRARVPEGLGTWTGIWMLPTDWTYGGWPASGEIDIMEFVGMEADSIYGTVHTEAYNGMIGTQVGGKTYMPDAADEFHTYSIDWREDGIRWYIDDQLYQEYPNDGQGYTSWPFDQKFHLILNLAVGGNWGGASGVDTTIWPKRLEIDYVRVYQ